MVNRSLGILFRERLVTKLANVHRVVSMTATSESSISGHGEAVVVRRQPAPGNPMTAVPRTAAIQTSSGR
jgi:hypothetical protein